MKVQWTHAVVSRNKEKKLITQTMVVSADYDAGEDAIDDIEVWIYEGDKKMEISLLLQKAEGNPLLTMIEAIDWRELYSDHKEYRRQLREESQSEY